MWIVRPGGEEEEEEEVRDVCATTLTVCRLHLGGESGGLARFTTRPCRHSQRQAGSSRTSLSPLSQTREENTQPLEETLLRQWRKHYRLAQEIPLFNLNTQSLRQTAGGLHSSRRKIISTTNTQPDSSTQRAAR